MTKKNGNPLSWISIKKITVIILMTIFIPVVKGGNPTIIDQLVKMGFENVREVEDDKEIVYTIENNVYSIEAVGIEKAIREIQASGLVRGKKCIVIVTDNNIPLLALTYKATQNKVEKESAVEWNVTTRDFGRSWDKVKNEKKMNNSFLDVDFVVYPQLYFKNYIINQIYQVLIEVSPAIEVTLWTGAKFTAQIIIPAYNDGYKEENKNVRPGYITLQQQFRLPWNITGDVRIGLFDSRRYGGEINLKYFFPDEHFSLAGKLAFVGNGYYEDIKTFKYNNDNKWYWSIGSDYYWSKYNMAFSLRAEQYLLNEIGVRLDVMRHYKYCSIGLYAEKAQHAESNGGFRIYVALPPYKCKRYKKLPRVTTGLATGFSYNGGNERTYYKMPVTMADDNPLKRNQYNPYFVKNNINK